ncbi:MAG: sigma-70 family RNA polymerase sigma factor [Phycisphaerae bacterium]
MNPIGPVTHVLAEIAAGSDSAVARLLPLVYDELRALARSHFREQKADHTLQPTALVHEAFVKMVGISAEKLRDRDHFFAVAATAMRQILIDHARRKQADKRGGDRERVTLDLAGPVGDDSALSVGGVDVLTLEDALQRLAERDERKARIVELRVYAGLTCEQTAQVLGVSPKTVEADWYMARAWLRRELQ